MLTQMFNTFVKWTTSHPKPAIIILRIWPMREWDIWPPWIHCIFSIAIYAINQPIMWNLNTIWRNSTLTFQFGLSETWLTDLNHDLSSLSGYNYVEVHRGEKAAGGVSLFIRKDISFQERKELNSSFDKMACVFIEIDKIVFETKTNIKVGVIFNPTDTKLDDFFEILQPVINCIDKENKQCYLIGYSFDLLKVDKHPRTAQYLALMYSHSFVPTICRPTRVTSKTATLR